MAILLRDLSKQNLCHFEIYSNCPLVPRILNEEYVPHARKVVEHFIQGQGGILALEVKWRKHFLETMKPKHMPPNWSIDHQKERLDIKASENRIDPHEYKMALGQK